MKKQSVLFFVSLLSFFGAVAQSVGPYQIDASEVFKSPRKHKVLSPVGYGKDGIVQVSSRGSKSFAFQLFSNDLKYEKGNIVNTEMMLNDRTYYERFVKFKNKTYLFVRDVNREAQTEGISALEFSQNELGFVGQSKNLFQSSGKVRMPGSGFSFGYSQMYGTQSQGLSSTPTSTYSFFTSSDKTKFLYTYSLVPKERKDAINKDVVGIYVFDENLIKQFGGEYEMPYTEAKMDNLSYTVANDGTVYLLARVYETERPKESGKDNKPNYHFEVLVYDKQTKIPTSIKLKLDSNFPKEAYIYEDAAHRIVVSGFYGKSLYGPIDGAYMVKFEVKDGIASKVNGDFYPIPDDIIKSYASDREKRRMIQMAGAGRGGANGGNPFDVGVDNLKIRKIYEMNNGSTNIVSEQYRVDVISYYDFNCKCYRTSYYTYADDIFVMNIDSAGTLAWTKKIPKAQYSGDAYGDGLSINSISTGNTLHIFFIDNIKNLNLSPMEVPKVHMNGRGGYLTGVAIDEKGTVSKYSLGEINKFKTHFFIRGFVNGGNNNLISTERKKKKNKLFSLEVKSPK
jgi:hypothetical protein